MEIESTVDCHQQGAWLAFGLGVWWILLSAFSGVLLFAFRDHHQVAQMVVGMFWLSDSIIQCVFALNFNFRTMRMN